MELRQGDYQTEQGHNHEMYQKGEIQMNGKHMENNTKENHPIVVVGVGGCEKDSFQCYALKPKLNKPLC